MQHAWGRGEMRKKFWFEILKERNLLEELDEDGSVVIKCISEKQDGRVQTGPLAAWCEHGDERDGFIKGVEFVD
jgi:hypothetical protein